MTKDNEQEIKEKKEQKSIKKLKSKFKKRKKTPIRNLTPSYDKKLISFKAWFSNMLNIDKRIKSHHKTTIMIYMKGLGLGEHESKERYESALRTYFGE